MSTITFDRAFWRSQARDLLIIFLVSLPAAYLSCSSCFTNPKALAILLPINFVLWTVLWKGNEFMSDLLNRYYSWIEAPVKRLIGGIFAHTVYTVIAIVCLFYLFELIPGVRMGGLEKTLTYAVIITLAISVVLHSVSFLGEWRKSAVESERMKKEMISARYESLKNQVNPHFLFNSLNALSNLVYEDQEQADKFIRKLSEVYRYVLEFREKDLVDLSTELEFIRSYLFLQKIRFGDGLQVEMNVDKQPNVKVPPMSVQMLIENAIKHNVISEVQPLKINIFVEGDYLRVVNNLEKKMVLREDSSRVGLSNIKARFSFLTKEPVVIDSENGLFTVGLPLLKS